MKKMWDPLFWISHFLCAKIKIFNKVRYENKIRKNCKLAFFLSVNYVKLVMYRWADKSIDIFLSFFNISKKKQINKVITKN